MTEEAVQKLILDCFEEYYPSWAEDWVEPGFDGYAGLPLEIKMLPVSCLLEHNTIKGGWAQTLWNCFGNWRELIAVARAGYELIGGRGLAVESSFSIDLFELFGLKQVYPGWLTKDLMNSTKAFAL